jgi:hypothetical protein
MQRPATVGVGPADPDARPAGQLADELLARLLAHEELVERLTVPAEPQVLLLAVELEPHPEGRPGEVQSSHQDALLVADLDLRLRLRQVHHPAEVRGA